VASSPARTRTRWRFPTSPVPAPQQAHQLRVRRAGAQQRHPRRYGLRGAYRYLPPRDCIMTITRWRLCALCYKKGRQSTSQSSRSRRVCAALHLKMGCYKKAFAFCDSLSPTVAVAGSAGDSILCFGSRPEMSPPCAKRLSIIFLDYAQGLLGQEALLAPPACEARVFPSCC
jgi:hypothetical protein